MILRSMLAEVPSLPASRPKLFASSQSPFGNDEAVILYTESEVIPHNFRVLRIGLVPNDGSETKEDRDCPGQIKITLYGSEDDGVSQWVVDTINVDGISVTPGGLGFRSSGGIQWEVPDGYSSVAEITRARIGTKTEPFLYTGLELNQLPSMSVPVTSEIANIRLCPLTRTLKYMDLRSLEPIDRSKIVLVDIDGKVVWHFSDKILHYVSKVYERQVPIFMLPVICVWRDLGTTIVDKTSLLY